MPFDEGNDPHVAVFVLRLGAFAAALREAGAVGKGQAGAWSGNRLRQVFVWFIFMYRVYRQGVCEFMEGLIS